MKLKMKPLSFAIVQALSIAFGATAILANAQTAVPAPQVIDKIEITGSSIKRLEGEGALPVTVVTRADIEKSGVQSTEDLLAQITSVSSAGNVVNAAQSGLSTYGQSSVSWLGQDFGTGQRSPPSGVRR